jgi:hypothetical protein
MQTPQEIVDSLIIGHNSGNATLVETAVELIRKERTVYDDLLLTLLVRASPLGLERLMMFMTDNGLMERDDVLTCVAARAVYASGDERGYIEAAIRGAGYTSDNSEMRRIHIEKVVTDYRREKLSFVPPEAEGDSKDY